MTRAHGAIYDSLQCPGSSAQGANNSNTDHCLYSTPAFYDVNVPHHHGPRADLVHGYGTLSTTSTVSSPHVLTTASVSNLEDCSVDGDHRRYSEHTATDQVHHYHHHQRSNMATATGNSDNSSTFSDDNSDDYSSEEDSCGHRPVEGQQSCAITLPMEEIATPIINTAPSLPPFPSLHCSLGPVVAAAAEVDHQEMNRIGNFVYNECASADPNVLIQTSPTQHQQQYTTPITHPASTLVHGHSSFHSMYSPYTLHAHTNNHHQHQHPLPPPPPPPLPSAHQSQVFSVYNLVPMQQQSVVVAAAAGASSSAAGPIQSQSLAQQFIYLTTPNQSSFSPVVLPTNYAQQPSMVGHAAATALMDYQAECFVPPLPQPCSSSMLQVSPPTPPPPQQQQYIDLSSSIAVSSSSAESLLSSVAAAKAANDDLQLPDVRLTPVLLNEASCDHDEDEEDEDDGEAVAGEHVSQSSSSFTPSPSLTPTLPLSTIYAVVSSPATYIPSYEDLADKHHPVEDAYTPHVDASNIDGTIREANTLSSSSSSSTSSNDNSNSSSLEEISASDTLCDILEKTIVESIPA